ncbi:hypothetical protein [Rhodococcoides yunnanense]|uniref:hypothetical protein n=1 Tax=Rhodococcoides yunnanense TaxID=278209 RepID=UPI0009347373|nr:hypothetical protein [Rhodococcus yunnanensis]
MTRKPAAELGILVVGVVLIAASRVLDLEELFVSGVFVCIFAGLAALISGPMSRLSAKLTVVVTVVGLVCGVFGLVWGIVHADEPEIFSPVFLGYLGGGVALSGICTLLDRRNADVGRR